MKPLSALALVLLAALPLAGHAQANQPPVAQAASWDGCPYFPLDNGSFLLKGNKLVTLNKECEGPEHPYGVVVSQGSGRASIYVREKEKNLASICTVITNNPKSSRCVPANDFDPTPFESHPPKRYTLAQLGTVTRYGTPQSLDCMARNGFSRQQWRNKEATPVQTVGYLKCVAGIEETDIPQPDESSSTRPVSPVLATTPGAQASPTAPGQ